MKNLLIFFIAVIFFSCSELVEKQSSNCFGNYSPKAIGLLSRILEVSDDIIREKYPSRNIATSYRNFLDSLLQNLNNRHQLLPIHTDSSVEKIFKEVDTLIILELFRGSAIRRLNVPLDDNYRQISINIGEQYRSFLEELLENNSSLKPYISRVLSVRDPSSEMGILELSNVDLDFNPEERTLIALEYLVLSSYNFNLTSYPLLE